MADLRSRSQATAAMPQVQGEDTLEIVRGKVREMLTKSASFRNLPPEQQVCPQNPPNTGPP